MPSAHHQIEVSQPGCRHLRATRRLTENIRLGHAGCAVLDSTNQRSDTSLSTERSGQTDGSVVGESLFNKHTEPIGDQIGTRINREIVVIHVLSQNCCSSDGDITIPTGTIDQVIAGTLFATPVDAVECACHISRANRSTGPCPRLDSL